MFFKINIRILLIVAIAAITSILPANGQFNLPQFLLQTQNIRNMSNFGTEFSFTIPQTIMKTSGINPTIKLVIYSYNEALVELSIPSKSWKESVEIPKNIEKIIEIQPEIAFPGLISSQIPVFTESIFKKSAIRLVSDYPVAVYLVVSGDDQGEATMLLPVSSLGLNYSLSSYIDPTSQIASLIPFPAIAGISAPFDNTRITVKRYGTMVSQFPISKTLDAGDCWYLYFAGNYGDLSGVEVTADKPISILTANQFAYIPIQNKPGNYLLEMELPTMLWGKSYHIPKYLKRVQNPITKIYANQPDTKIFVNGTYLTTLLSSTNPSNFVEHRIPFTNVNGIEVISADKPIAVNVYQTAYTEEIPNRDFMLPNRICLVPIEQYSKSLLMNAPRYLLINPNTQFNLVLITKVNIDGSIPDNLEISYWNNNTQVKQKISQMNIIDKKDVNYIAGDRYSQLTIPITFKSNFEIFGESFSAYIITTDGEAFSGFSGGINFKNMLTGDSEPPRPIWTQYCDGTVTGITTDYPEDNQIRSNLNLPIYHSNVSKNFEKAFTTVVPGTTKSMSWNLKVRNKSQNAFAVITFRDYAGNDTTITIEYKAYNLLVTPSIIDFGNVLPGTIHTKDVKIKNITDTIITLNQLELKQLNQSFRLPKDFKPIELMPNQEIDLKVEFFAEKSGLYEDSLGVNNGCYTHFYSKLSARIGDAKIIATDINYGDVLINSQQVAEAQITNIGENELIIWNYTVSNPSEIVVDFGKYIDLDKPLILKPNETHKFKVFITANKEKFYNETITFHSNAKGNDSITYITAKAIKPGLLTTSLNLNKVRKDKSLNPVPIKYQNAIKIENTGNTPLTIQEVRIDPLSNNPGAFDVIFSGVVGKTLKPKEKLFVDVNFFPIQLGENNITLEFITDLQQIAQSTITAFVVIPKVIVDAKTVEFDSTLVRSTLNESLRTIKITNLKENEWEYADTVTIYGIKSFDKKLALTKDEFLELPFYFNEKAYQFPKIILPGESLTLDFLFNAKQTAWNTAELLILTNADEDPDLLLKGWGLDRVLSITDLSLETCVGNVTEGICKIKNNSSQAVEITKLELTNSNFFEIINPIQDKEKIEPNTEYSVKVRFKPTTTTLQFSDLLCYLSGDNIPSLSAKLTGKSNFYEIESTVSPISQNVLVGNEINLRYIILPSKEKIVQFENEFHIKINFTEEFLKFNPNSIKLGKNLSGKWKVSDIYSPRKFGEIEFDLISLSGNQKIDIGDFIELGFYTYLPQNQSNIGNIGINATPKNNQCFNLNQQTATVNLIIGCGGELQKYIVGENNYYLNVTNKTAESNSLEIDFGIAFDNYTNLVIFNSIGEKVVELVNGQYKSGNYKKEVDLTNLSSGLYNVYMQSGEYNQTAKIIINK